MRAQRHDFITVVSGKIICRAPGAVSFADLGARAYGEIGGTVDRLHVAVFGACVPCRAKIENRQPQFDFVTGLPRFTAFAVADVFGFQHAEITRGLGQAEAAGKAACILHRSLDVEPPLHCLLLDVQHVARRLRQIGQPLGQPVGDVIAPQSHQPAELFARGERGLARPGKLRGGIGIKGLLAGLVEFAEIAGQCHAPRQLRRRFGRAAHLFGIT